jgi:hypothetical protein
MHILTFIVSLSGFKLSSDKDEPSLQPENPDDIESGPLPVILPQQPAPAPAPLLPQQPAPAAAPFDFAPFMRETGGNTTAMKIRQEELPVICMNTMIYRTPLWPCLRFPWTGVLSVFTPSSNQIRYYKYVIYIYVL